MKKLPVLLLLCGLFTSSFGQLPSSNLYLFNIQKDLEKDSLYINEPRLLTITNKDGYNNHPYFITDQELMYSAKRSYENQPDLYTLDLVNLNRSKVTDTPPVGEYSPRRMPDYYNFSAVRMEFYPQDTVLRLWQFPLDRSDNGRPIFKDVINIGYYAWLNSRDIALFLVGSPNQLVLADIYSNTMNTVAKNVGRCFLPAGDGSVYYVQLSETENAVINRYFPNTFGGNNIQKVTETVPGAVDFAMMFDGTLLMANDSEIFYFRPGYDTEWQPLVDLRIYNITGITRLELSPDNSKLVIVGR